MRKVITIACLASFAVGAIATICFLRFGQQVTSDWFELVKASSPIGFSTEALFESDIRLPQVKEISGKAKFLPEGNVPNSHQLGYLVHVVVLPLNLKIVPEKYLKEKPIGVKGDKMVRPAIEQVYYEAELDFELKDKDGFTLAKLVSHSETIRSGMDNQLQQFALKPVANDVAARTKTIYVHLHVKKCSTCEGE